MKCDIQYNLAIANAIFYTEKTMKICKSITPTFECSILVPINGGNTQSFSQKSRNDDTEKIKSFDFNVKDSAILFEWIKELERLYGYAFHNPGRIIIKTNMVSRVFENAKTYFNSKALLFHKHVYKKLQEAFILAAETKKPLEIQTSLSREFGSCITVPLNKNGFDQLEHCHENKACQEEWYIHKSQVEILLEKFLFEVAADYHIPYMDTYETPVLPAENVDAILKDINSVKVTDEVEKEVFSFLKEALHLAKEKKMPVYLFF